MPGTKGRYTEYRTVGACEVYGNKGNKGKGEEQK